MLDTIETQYQEKLNSSFYDNLTGLYNHGIFDQFLNWELSKFKRHAIPFFFCLIDIDGFNFFNQRRGAIEGDFMLKIIAKAIKISIRESDLAARYNGDRFAAILVKTSVEGASIAAERIRTTVTDMTNHQLTVSIGLSGIPCPDSSPEGNVLSQASSALLEAKLRGKNRVVWYKEKKNKARVQSGRILIVDDEPRNLKLLEAVLMPLGYEIIKANTRTVLKGMTSHSRHASLLLRIFLMHSLPIGLTEKRCHKTRHYLF